MGAKGKLETYTNQQFVNNWAVLTIPHYLYYIGHIYRSCMVDTIYYSLFSNLIIMAANNFSKPVGHNVRKKWNSVGHLQKPVGHKLL